MEKNNAYKAEEKKNTSTGMKRRIEKKIEKGLAASVVLGILGSLWTSSGFQITEFIGFV